MNEKPKKIRAAIVALAIAIPAVAIFGVSTGVRTASAEPNKSVATQKSLPVVVGTDGKVARLLASNGQAVKKGQVIAELDTSSLEQKLAQLQMELQAAEAKGQNAIQPFGLGGIAGALPKSAPQPTYIRVPVKTEVKAKPAPTAVSTSPKQTLRAETAKPAPKNLLADAQKDKVSREAAVKEAEAALETAQRKADEAQKLAKSTAAKAAEAQDLLTAGAISEERKKEILETDEQAQHNLAYFLVDLEGAKRGLAKAQEAAKAAELQLAKATTESAQASVVKPEPVKTAPKATPAKPLQKETTRYETKMVLKQVPGTRAEAPKAVPVRVFVDEQAFKTSEDKRADLEKEIAEIQAEIEACKILAPADGIIFFLVAPGVEIDAEAPVANLVLA